MKLWHIAALVVAGLLVGTLHPGYVGNFFHYATFYVFLPAIIFEAAWQLDLRVMREGWRAIVLLAVPGVIVTAGVVAAIVHFAAHEPVGTALVLGAVLSATDPVAVTAIFRKLRVPGVLSTIVESESLLNDAIAVVLFRAIIAVVTLSAPDSGAVLSATFHGLLGSLLGVLVGGVCGYLGSFALRRSVPIALQTVVTFAAAYAAYLISDAFTWSGIFATIACAMTMRELERSYGTVDMAKGVERTWNVAATVSNAILFLLIGASVDLAHLRGLFPVLAWTILAVVIARVMLAYGLLRLAPAMARSWMTVVRLAGVRGAVSLALAISVTASVPHQDVIVAATFAVVVATLLIGSLTYERRIKRLDLG